MEISQNKYKIYNGFLLLIFLNIFDGIATYVGLNKGFYLEKNAMLDYIYQSSGTIFIYTKVIIPTIVLTSLMIVIRDNVTKIIKVMVYIGNTVYIFLFIYHICLYSLAFKLAFY